MHTSIIQILKVNDVRKGTGKTGRPYELQDAECILYADDGTVSQVGVLLLPNELRGNCVPGTYTGTFALRADRDRRINAVLTSLTPVPSGTSASRQSKASA